MRTAELVCVADGEDGGGGRGGRTVAAGVMLGAFVDAQGPSR
jgi:hypothetical protein